LLLLLLRLAFERGFNKEILRHPVTIAIISYLVWIFFTSLTSTMPLVSFKFLLVKIWFIAGFYILGIRLFDDRKNFSRIIWLYVASLLIVIGYTVTRHAGYGLLDKQAAHFVMTPFFNDHTSYGAVIAMFIPFLMIFSFNSFSKPALKWMARIFLLILTGALVLSYSRAAWLSLIVALFIWILIGLRIRFRTLMVTFVTILFLVLVFQKQLVMYLERNNEESSSNLIEHFSSISNITSDASNLERINRWSCAVRMFCDRPLLGYGPGTYMFKYAPYQLTKDRTIISTNSADGGGAHSEYLGPMAESGLPGLLTFIMILGTLFYTAFRAYERVKEAKTKAWLTGALIGLISYCFHGLMNNFLDTDKASVPFWGFTAMIVTIDLWSRRESQSAEIVKNPVK
jgi:O-antigen ligase